MRTFIRPGLLIAATALLPFSACSSPNPPPPAASDPCLTRDQCPAGHACVSGVCTWTQTPSTGGQAPFGSGGTSSSSGGSFASSGGATSGGSGVGTGGSFGTGGQAAGGNAPLGGQTAGGAVASGGQPFASGGASMNGGSSGNAGAVATGGSQTGGNTQGLGGNTAKGGSGGTQNFGGNFAQGGSNSSGGTSKGGTTGTGGMSKGGSSQGGSSSGGMPGTGGATSTNCTMPASPNPGSASFTWYELNQGTCQNFGCQTACGYQGNSGNEIKNIVEPRYFAAIPAPTPSNFTTSKYCGACAEVTNPANGRKLVVTIVDMCPEDTNAPCRSNPSSHLDLSKPAFDQLGFTRGDPSGTTWRFVPCNVTGNVVIRVKSGNPNEIYIENEIVPIQSVSLNGQMASRQSYGAWHFSQNIPQGAVLTLTDLAGRTLAVTVTSTTANQNQDTGAQFPRCN